VSEVILKPEGGKAKTSVRHLARDTRRWDGERMTTGAVTGDFMWMNADVVKPIAKGHDNRSTATSFNLGLVSCAETRGSISMLRRVGSSTTDADDC
jgi:hypothetical protein